MGPIPTDRHKVQVMSGKRRTKITIVLLAIGTAMIIGYSIGFHILMAYEGQPHSLLTAVYWTITTMSTLGYGDITFESDIGRLFSLLVLVSGAVFLLVLVPYFIVQYVVTPWLDIRDAARTPRRAPEDMKDHLVLVGNDAIVNTLIARAERSRVPYVLVLDDTDEATTLHDQGISIVVGPLDAPSTYRNAGVERARVVITTLADTTNTNIAFTVQQVAHDVPVAVTASKAASVDVLELAGADHILQLGAILGEEMANRVLGTTGRSHRIGSFGNTVIAEAAARDTALVGMTLREAKQSMNCKVRILAIMKRGRLRPMEPGLKVTEDTILVIAGGAEELANYDEQFARSASGEAPVLVLGGGRVGRAAATEFTRTDTPTTIVEHLEGRAPDKFEVVIGDAADVDVLKDAGLQDAAAVLITTHDDDLNVYLTLSCRRLRPDIQVVARATSERNVSTLYRAGADSVLSYATIGATDLWNAAALSHRVVIAEGNELFLVPPPASLARLAVRNAGVHERTGCHILAVTDAQGTLRPDAEQVPAGSGQLLVLGNRHAEERFREVYLKQKR